MSRVSAFGALLAASVFLAPAAWAGAAGPGESPAIQLLRNGIAGTGNMVAKAPVIAIRAGGLSPTFRKTTLAEIAAKLGGTVNSIPDGQSRFAWVCYASPQGAEEPATLVLVAASAQDSAATRGIAYIDATTRKSAS